MLTATKACFLVQGEITKLLSGKYPILRLTTLGTVWTVILLIANIHDPTITSSTGLRHVVGEEIYG